MRKILIISKDPFLDKIPNLMTMIRYFSGKGDFVNIVSIVSDEYLTPSFPGMDNVVFKGLRFDDNKRILPSTLLLFGHLVRMFLRDGGLFNRYDCIIGTGYYGNMIAFFISKLFGIYYVNHCLEYPVFKNFTHEKYGLINAFFNAMVMGKSDLIVTHDDVHIDLMSDKLSIRRGKFMALPNSTTGDVVRRKSDSIRKACDIGKDQAVILHSGGLGKWFGSHMLAECTGGWADDNVLVFHTSHLVDDDPYYIRMKQDDYKGRVLFSVKPIPSECLDDFISGADIGIAWYDKSVLGYRCEYMGLAAGKIGNYLKCGIPVITNNFDSLSSYINRYKCGVCVDRLEEVGAAISEIRSKYEVYRDNAFTCYENLWKPEPYLESIYSRVFNH